MTPFFVLIMTDWITKKTAMLENNSQSTVTEVSTFFVPFYYLLICYASSEWIRLWLRRPVPFPSYTTNVEGPKDVNRRSGLR
jgi:hypothetical protein